MKYIPSPTTITLSNKPWKRLRINLLYAWNDSQTLPHKNTTLCEGTSTMTSDSGGAHPADSFKGPPDGHVNVRHLTILQSPQVQSPKKSEREQKAHSIRDDNPLIDGRGSRRHMRGRLDMVQRSGVQRRWAYMLVCQCRRDVSSDLFTGQ